MIFQQQHTTTVEIPEDGLALPQRSYAMVVLALGTFMALLDATIANVALPSLSRAFEITPAQSMWIVNAFQIAVAASLLPLSALGRRVTYRSVYQGGLIVFTFASLACALSHTFGSLVVARVLQGVGAAGMLSVGPAILRFIFPQRLLGQGLGFYSLNAATSSALGPTLGGLILSVAPWPWIFAINVPVGILAVVLAKRFLPPSTRQPISLDILSVFCSAFGLMFLVLGLDAIARRLLIAGGAAMAGGAVLLLWFVMRQARITYPLLDFRLFAPIRFRSAALTSYVSFTGQGIALTALPFLFYENFSMNPLHIGLLLSTWPLTIMLVGPWAGRLADRYPAPLISSAGLALFSCGLVLQGSTSTSPLTAFSAVWHTMLCGLGFGCFQPPNNRELMGSVSRDLAGGASGVLATVRVLGQTTGTAITALCLYDTHTGARVHVALLVAAVIAGGAFFVSISRLRVAKF
jgi:DHA2 family multidrug resistance protein-like MFS transporter